MTRRSTRSPAASSCGPNRREGDGLRLFPGRVPGSDLFAAPWVPADVDDEILWAALDCPSSAVIYLDDERPPPHVLGRIAAQIRRRPEPGAEHVIMSWLIGRDGCKVNSASAIYGPDARRVRRRPLHLDQPPTECVSLVGGERSARRSVRNGMS